MKKVLRFFSVLVCSMGITSIVFAQQAQKMPAITQEIARNIPIFIQQARALGFSDKDIAQTLDGILKKGLTEQGLAEFLKKLEDTENMHEKKERESSLFTYVVLGCCGIIVGWLLYELYKDITLKNTCEVSITTDPEDAIPNNKLKKAEERIVRALKADEEPRGIVSDLAKKYEGVCVKARWNHGGAHRNVTFEF